MAAYILAVQALNQGCHIFSIPPPGFNNRAYAWAVALALSAVLPLARALWLVRRPRRRPAMATANLALAVELVAAGAITWWLIPFAWCDFWPVT